ncbi:MAG: H/ACA ribonucleoprotein complex subunit GAR1 [Nitrososphaerales archaeon]
MQEAGTVLHLARSGRLILKSSGGTTTSSLVKEGSILVDEKGRRTCKVLEIIGPVFSPYISAQPLTDRIERVAGSKLFVSEEERPSESRRSGKSYGRRFNRPGMAKNNRRKSFGARS